MKPKNTKYTPEFKKEVCEFAIHDTISSSANFYNLSRITVTKWVKGYKLFGENSFAYRKKRTVTQKTKLDNETLLKIKFLRDTNPKLSFNNIIEQLNLNCDISLISRKLKKLEEELKIELYTKKTATFLYIFINVLSQTIKHGEVLSLYQINICDNNFENHCIGFSSFKNNTNLCVFMDYVLSNIQGLEQFKKITKIKTNIEYLDQRGSRKEFDRFIKDKYNIDLEYTTNIDFPINSKLDYVKTSKVQDLFHETYKKLIKDKSVRELENGILIPPIFIDDFIQDTNKIISFNNYWNVLSLPDQQRNILANVIEEIEKLGDAAKISFDFDNALELYNKIYLTTLNCDNVDEVKANSLMKQADIYYHLDNFDLSKELFSDTLKLSSKLAKHELSAKAYYYLGMISYTLTHTKEADELFDKSLKKYLKSEYNYSFDYYKTNVRKFINLRKYENALRSVNSFIEIAKNNNNNSSIANGYSLKGIVYYFMKNYQQAEKMYLKQKSISAENDDLGNTALSIIHLISLYSYFIEKDHNVLNELMNELLNITKIIKKESYIAEANYRIGLFNYNKQKYNEAEYFLILAASQYKKYSYNYLYLSNLYFLGKTFYLLKKHIKAIRTLTELINLSHLNNNHKYLIYCHNTLGKIYFEKKEIKPAIDNFNLSIRLGEKEHNNAILADSNKFLGLMYKELNEAQLAHHYFSESLKFYNIYTKNHKNINLSKELELIKKELFLIE
ncbi:MAG: tetratricopeptide repeat protein [Candidatus Delongbacteria bacterium]|jgi:tetratricopeptide (TPR) repeat protein|nr:tetratricopeptide repeat protein [Candidatus Delongbacteria bacterium]